ncbi:hypothetical protein ACIGHG_01855 [Bacillus sp. NPDC077411]|uniref:hypothetical protein n=1 Tax=Bacillus sp. NPDC077411 TaxID=3363947 RepID=UPI0037C5D5B9
MSFPIIPNITPNISISTPQTIPLLLASIAFEELALAHVINAQAEELQFVLGTLETGIAPSPPVVTLSNLLAIDSSVQRTLRDVIKKEMLLEFKFENILDLITNTSPAPTPVLLTQQIFSFTGGLQTTTVPPGATSATIQAIGAAGSLGAFSSPSGKGAFIQGDFTVISGEPLAILVGGMDSNLGVLAGGGGGGSFIWRGSGFGDLSPSTLLVAAGGGGGAVDVVNVGQDASTSPNGTTGNPLGGNGGANGNGGAGGTDTTFGGGGGGAGIFSNGGTGSAGAGGTVGGGGGTNIIAGADGGSPGTFGADGGFGGGGAGGANGGGGGGYSGGSGGSAQAIGSFSAGGGGGSLNNGTNQVNTAGAGTGNGVVVIKFFGT